jgi:hypothetical protein
MISTTRSPRKSYGHAYVVEGALWTRVPYDRATRGSRGASTIRQENPHVSPLCARSGVVLPYAWMIRAWGLRCGMQGRAPEEPKKRGAGWWCRCRTCGSCIPTARMAASLNPVEASIVSPDDCIARLNNCFCFFGTEQQLIDARKAGIR